jgi:hypothetical protein
VSVLVHVLVVFMVAPRIGIGGAGAPRPGDDGAREERTVYVMLPEPAPPARDAAAPVRPTMRPAGPPPLVSAPAIEFDQIVLPTDFDVGEDSWLRPDSGDPGPYPVGAPVRSAAAAGADARSLGVPRGAPPIWECVSILRASAPPGVRGDTVLTRLRVDSLGVVTSVELVRAPRDRANTEVLKGAARGWWYQPARDAANRPVAGVFEVTFIL